MSATVTPPDICKDSYPCCEILAGDTLCSEDVKGKRGFKVYDLGQVFGKDAPVKLSEHFWKAVIQKLLSAWDLFGDGLILDVSSYKTVRSLKNWARPFQCHSPRWLI